MNENTYNTLLDEVIFAHASEDYTYIETVCLQASNIAARLIECKKHDDILDYTSTFYRIECEHSAMHGHVYHSFSVACNVYTDAMTEAFVQKLEANFKLQLRLESAARAEALARLTILHS